MFALVKLFLIVVMPQSPVRESKGLFSSPTKTPGRRGGNLRDGSASDFDAYEDVNPQFAPVSAFDLMEEDLGNCPDAANDDTSDEESGNKDFDERLPGLRKNKYVDIEAEESGGEGGGEEEHELDETESDKAFVDNQTEESDWATEGEDPDQYIEIYTVLDTQPLSLSFMGS